MNLVEQLHNFFEVDDWPFQYNEEHAVFQTAFKGKSGQWPMVARVHRELELIIIYSVCPVAVPDDRRYAMAELLTRANYGMFIGNFEMDFDDGEVRFKTSVDVENGEATFELIKQLVYVNVSTMDRYFPGIMSVTYGQTDPVDAIRAIEGE